MHYSFYELEKAIYSYLNQNDLETALQMISEFVETVINHPLSHPLLLSSKALDNLCQKIGAQTFEPLIKTLFFSPVEKDLVIYVASEVMNSGGHTAVIKDLISLQPHKKHLILLTNLFKRSDCDKMQTYFDSLAVQILYPQESSFRGKLEWLQKNLFDLRPGRTFLFNHHHDSIAIAAMQPCLNQELLFYHHGDHHLCLGVHLSYALHIDPHSFGFFNCRNHLHVKNNIYWPLVVLDRPSHSFEKKKTKQEPLKTSSSGSEIKFASPYAFSYIDLIPDVLMTTKGSHLHIGYLSSFSLEKVYKKMDSLHINRNRFIYVPWVKSVWQAMIDYQVDVYISSFPKVGLKATVEVLGSGTPVIFHENYNSQLLGASFMGYPEAFTWRYPHELLTHLGVLSQDQLTKESKQARLFYEQNYKPSFLVQELNKSGQQMKGYTPSPLPFFQTDSLQMYLDNMQQFKQLKDEKTDFQNYIYKTTSWRLTAPIRKIKEQMIKYKKLIFNFFN